MKRLPADRKEGRFKNWKGGKRESHPRENLISKNSYAGSIKVKGQK